MRCRAVYHAVEHLSNCVMVEKFYWCLHDMMLLEVAVEKVIFCSRALCYK